MPDLIDLAWISILVVCVLCGSLLGLARYRRRARLREILRMVQGYDL